MTKNQREALELIAGRMKLVASDFEENSIDDYTRQIIILTVRKMTDHDIFVDYLIHRIFFDLETLLQVVGLPDIAMLRIVKAFNLASILSSQRPC